MVEVSSFEWGAFFSTLAIIMTIGGIGWLVVLLIKTNRYLEKIVKDKSKE